MTKVKSVSTAKLLCDHRLRHHLMPFLARENTLAGAAQMLRLSPQRMSYWVNKLLQAKLVTLVRHEQRAGHPSAVYRSVEDTYTVPLTLVDSEDLSRLLASTQDLHFKQLQKSMLRNLLLAKDRLQLRLWRNGQDPVEAVENASDPADHFGMASQAHALYLGKEEMAQLQQDVRALVARYEAASDRTKNEPVMLYLGLAENPVWGTET